jgi:Ca-activated chloride channel homolog
MNKRESLWRVIIVLLVCISVGVSVAGTSAQKSSPSSQSKPSTQPTAQPKDKQLQEKGQPLQEKVDQSPKASPKQDAQSANQILETINEPIKIGTDFVELDVTVIDQSNNPVADLSKEDFTVYEDKVKQVIESVRREDVPISIGLVLDTSGSMREKIDTVIAAARDLVKQMKPADEGFAAQFKSETELLQGLTSDTLKLEKSMEGLVSNGGTAFFDSIINAAEYSHKNGKKRRKAIVIFTDGAERVSSVTEKEVVEAIKEYEVQVYLVGFTNEEDVTTFYGSTERKNARELLSRLALDSGGRAFFPNDLSEMAAIAAQIAKELQTQYVISYYPTNDKRDGTYRAVRVMVKPQGNRRLIARTRQGYYAK